MAHTILEFENPELENHERYIAAPVGFSWTTFFFAGNVLLYRKNIILYLLFSIVYIISFVVLTLGIARVIYYFVVEQGGAEYTTKILTLGALLSFFIIRFIIACFCNKYFMKILKKQGFKVIGVRRGVISSKQNKDIAFYNKKYGL